MADAVPERHAAQRDRAAATIANIEGTAFSTVTVNYDFRTALHQDAGDFRDGFGCLCVLHRPREPQGAGGELLFPEFRVGVRLRSNDALFFDTHQWHCNAPLPDEPDVHRMSLVCYLREKMVDNCPRAAEQRVPIDEAATQTVRRSPRLRARARDDDQTQRFDEHGAPAKRQRRH